MLQENLFQFIWQYSLYNPVDLKTTNGNSITIIHPGRLNIHAGPDFEEAKIKIGNTTLIGNVELHTKASDWTKHQHQHNQGYQNIILHVVYEDDAPGTEHPFAKLVMKPHIPDYVLDRYTHLLHTSHHIPCASQLDKVPVIIKEAQLNRMLAERWELKLQDWNDLLAQSAGNWLDVFYWRLAVNFGFKVNAAPFLQLARSIPFHLFARHRESLLQTEALLFGQAGMLEGSFKDDYPRLLQREYTFLKAKYQLQPLAKHQWKFLRLRPVNFPTIRIAQFAALLHQSLHLFSHTLEAQTVDRLRNLLNVTASDYWMDHYRFDEAHDKPLRKKLGMASVDNIIINTVAPVRFLFAHHQGHLSEQEKALHLLSHIAPEQNNILRLWNDSGWGAINAAQSQALIQLYTHYCSRKRCLECAIGLSIIKRNT
ncbi:MAG TPA: DUF2851 family protein [Flavipsychrobacter sp.]|nr:DUF2851 family protein [Flavipsychrobacter sp.]